ncbi:MAG TPA: LEPR-XLL domain-containing protein [Tepidisphaeraceae bacterium]|jgi:subtilase family serine protease
MMLSRCFDRSRSKAVRGVACFGKPFESMEPRMLLSAAPLATHHPANHHSLTHEVVHLQHHQHQNDAGADAEPNLIRQSPNSTRTYVGYGLTPQIIRTAYDFGSTGTEGAGQTIAIIDAYDDPNIAKDLVTFDSQFSLVGTNTNTAGTNGSVFNFFSKVNQSGGSKLPQANSGWAQEISLDVEWAHAMAPSANILLVEASSNSTTDLMAAVNYAKTGASVVSMSWGSAEFSGESSYDSSFAASNVTFVASAGDTGGQKEWPAESPNVVGVGGTTLSNSGGTYVSETGWSSSGGGTSTQEGIPAYQSALGYLHRSSPDVGYDADPNSGFAVYDSYRNQSQVGWMVFGGTSAGAPQWAALIATADQQRAGTGGKAALNSLSDTTNTAYAQSTLAAVYAMYTNQTAYASTNPDFHDITSGAAGSNQAHAGYDQVTGVGSPFAQNLINDLTNNVAA